MWQILRLLCAPEAIKCTASNLLQIIFGLYVYIPTKLHLNLLN